MGRNTTGHAGEAYVQSLLCLKGLTPLMAPAGNPGWDILVFETHKTISVKASNSSGFVAEFSPDDKFDVLAVVDAYENAYPRVWFIPRYVAIELKPTGNKIRVNPSDLAGDLAKFELNYNVL